MIYLSEIINLGFSISQKIPCPVALCSVCNVYVVDTVRVKEV